MKLNTIEMHKKQKNNSCGNIKLNGFYHKIFHSLLKNFQAFHRTSSDAKINIAIKLILKASALSRAEGKTLVYIITDYQHHFAPNFEGAHYTWYKSERNSHSHKNHSSSSSSTKDKHSGNPKIIQPLLATAWTTKFENFYSNIAADLFMTRKVERTILIVNSIGWNRYLTLLAWSSHVHISCHDISYPRASSSLVTLGLEHTRKYSEMIEKHPLMPVRCSSVRPL